MTVGILGERRCVCHAENVPSLWCVFILRSFYEMCAQQSIVLSVRNKMQAIVSAFWGLVLLEQDDTQIKVK